MRHFSKIFPRAAMLLLALALTLSSLVACSLASTELFSTEHDGQTVKLYGSSLGIDILRVYNAAGELTFEHEIENLGGEPLSADEGYGLTFADVNVDGTPDIYLPRGRGRFAFFIGRGEGKYIYDGEPSSLRDPVISDDGTFTVFIHERTTSVTASESEPEIYTEAREIHTYKYIDGIFTPQTVETLVYYSETDIYCRGSYVYDGAELSATAEDWIRPAGFSPRDEYPEFFVGRG